VTFLRWCVSMATAIVVLGVDVWREDIRHDYRQGP
jgi:hypothetical protein